MFSVRIDMMHPTAADTTTSLSATSKAGLLIVYATTLFLSAFLLFAVQPMFAKLVLPKLGGSAGVWSVAMVFFQSALLAGYGVAHLLSSRLPLRTSVALHLGLLGVCALALPIALPADWGAPPAEGTALWVFGLFAVSLGLPFLAVAVNGPLLQAWFARTGHPHGADPYFLYGASNIGSFAALLAYPTVIETLIGAGAQTALWSGGYYALMAMVMACGVLALARAGSGPTRLAADVRDAAGPAPTIALRARWVGLAFVPSGLLVAVTAHISTDVAAAPFLWVVPLALFLLTFVITFQRQPVLPHRIVVVAQPLMVAVLALVMNFGLGIPLVASVAVHLAGFFVCAMLCHGELVRLRPDPRHLTEFYLSMSLGGVLGGLFCGLLAPALFSTVLEYPLLIVAATLCRPGFWSDAPETRRTDGLFALAVAAGLAAPALLGLSSGILAGLPFALLVAGFSAVAILWRSAPRRFSTVVAASLVLVLVYNPASRLEEHFRSFYGVHRVATTPDGHHRLLLHGNTVHGARQLLDASGRPVTGKPEPLSYYWDGSGLARALTAARAAQGGRIADVGVIGLGTGSLACQSRPGERWHFFEIDPVVVRLAEDPGLFGFLSACADDATVTLGDARLTLGETPTRFGALVVDAFSSDAIPAHLLTRDALRTYLDRLAPGGVIAFHISNRHMELTSVVATMADAEGLVTYRGAFDGDPADPLKMPSLVVVVARSAADVGALSRDPAWTRVVAKPGVAPWTDDRSAILSSILRKYRDEPGWEAADAVDR